VDDEERFERLTEVLDELVVANLETPILVEGRRDVASLRILGCAGEVHALHAGATLHDRAEALAAAGVREIILLTDWDKKGAELFDRMRALLAANKVRVNGEYRDKIRLWMRPPVKDVESLAGYVARNLARYHEREPDERRRREGS
jgi:5S rRNA maturation endonuclease (ribonuclease M5)